MKGYLKQVVEVQYKQDTILIDEYNRVFKVLSCFDLTWLFNGEKTGYYLTAKYLYTKEKKK